MSKITIKDALQIGIDAHRSGDISTAKRYYTAILAIDPGHKHANHNLGLLAAHQGKHALSLEHFHKALENDRGETQFWISYIDALIKNGNYVLAQNEFDKAIISPQIDLQRIEVFGKQNNLKIKKRRAPVQVFNELHELYNKKKYSELIKSARSVIEQYPESPDILTLCGVAYADVNQHKMAIKLYRSALKYEEQHKPYYNLARSLKALGETSEALECYSKALTFNPNDSQIYNNIGVIHISSGDIEVGIKSYERALEISPNEPGILYNLGVAHRSNGAIGEAITCFRKCIQTNPSLLEAQNALGECFYLLGKYTEAKIAFDKVDTQASVAKSLECLFLDKEYDQFDKSLRKLCTTDPKNIRVAALSAYSSQQRDLADPYPFCRDPLSLVTVSNLQKYMDDVGSFLNKLLEELNKLNAIWEPQGKTTKSGFQSTAHLFDNAHGELKVLEEIIFNELNSFKRRSQNSDEIIFRGWPKEKKLSGWYVRLIKDGHQDSHIHPSGWVSGVIYLKTIKSPDANEGAIKFGLHGYGYDVIKNELPEIIHQPIDGDIVLFPSSLFHSTIPVKQDSERCVIAFDLVGGSTS